MRRLPLPVSLTACLALTLLAAAPAAGASGGVVPQRAGVTGQPDGVTVGPGGGTPGTSQNFQLVGHDPLFGRGMNAAATIFGNYMYIGNRTDGSSTCGIGDPRAPGPCPHIHPGVLIEDISDPANPHVVGEIGPPLEGNVGITSRELRVWPAQKLLVVMNFRCSFFLHACPRGNDTQFPYDLAFYSLADPLHPALISTYVPTSAAGMPVKPHEMYLWQDPNNPGRALLWISTPELTSNPAVPNMLIVDISQVPSGGSPVLIAQGTWNGLFENGGSETFFQFDLYTHSMAPTADGDTTYLSMEGGEMLVLDTSSVAQDDPPPGTVVNLNNDLISPPANRPIWGNPINTCTKQCPEGHSAVPVPGRPFVLTTDEIYGTFTDPTFGCPWGWVHLISVADPTHPAIVGEYKIAQDDQSFCGSPADDPATEQFTSYSSHNPTVLPDLAFVDWHSGGVQAINIANPASPQQAGWFSPTPLPSVATEDPALSRGPNKVVMWSYPIIRNGLIYVMDIRNGLYILRYTGPHAAEVAGIHFLEGNSNLGDAVALSQNGNGQ